MTTTSAHDCIEFNEKGFSYFHLLFSTSTLANTHVATFIVLAMQFQQNNAISWIISRAHRKLLVIRLFSADNKISALTYDLLKG